MEGATNAGESQRGAAWAAIVWLGEVGETRRGWRRRMKLFGV